MIRIEPDQILMKHLLNRWAQLECLGMQNVSAKWSILNDGTFKFEVTGPEYKTEKFGALWSIIDCILEMATKAPTEWENLALPHVRFQEPYYPKKIAISH